MPSAASPKVYRSQPAHMGMYRPSVCHAIRPRDRSCYLVAFNDIGVNIRMQMHIMHCVHVVDTLRGIATISRDWGVGGQRSLHPNNLILGDEYRQLFRSNLNPTPRRQCGPGRQAA